MEEQDNLFPFDSEYVLWYHSVTEKSWSKDSYINLCEDLPDKCIHNGIELWQLYNTLKNQFTAGMFFLMKKGIFPIWEDIHNKDGGYWSFKTQKKSTNSIWKRLTCAFVGNTLMKDIEHKDIITGISLSPKISNCVLKIWNNISTINKCDIFTKEIDFLQPDSIRYNTHKKS